MNFTKKQEQGTKLFANTRHCSHCGIDVLPRRIIGLPSFFLLVFTAGLWVFAMLFYSRKCPICGSMQFLENCKPEEKPNAEAATEGEEFIAELQIVPERNRV